MTIGVFLLVPSPKFEIRGTPGFLQIYSRYKLELDTHPSVVIS